MTDFSSLWTDSAWGNANWNSTVGINTYWHWLLFHANFFFFPLILIGHFRRVILRFHINEKTKWQECRLSLTWFDQLTKDGHIYCTVCSLQQQRCLSLGSQRTLTGRSQQATNQVKSFTFDLCLIWWDYEKVYFTPLQLSNRLIQIMECFLIVFVLLNRWES